MHVSFTSHVTFLSNLLEDVFHQNERIKPRRQRYGTQKNGTQHKENKGNFQNDGDVKSQDYIVDLVSKWSRLEQERRGLQRGWNLEE